MSPLEIGSLSVVALLVLIYAGMHVPVALMLVSFVSVWLMRDNFGLASRLLASTAAESISSYLFGIVPLFVLMGLLVSIADLGRDAFSAAETLFRRIKGGIGVATVAANAVFAAITGISIASAAVFTKVAVPEMARAGFKVRFAAGIVGGSSVLGMLIPPSLLMIIYAVLTEQSVGDLFVAGIVPGLLLAGVFAATIFGMAYLLPRQVFEAGGARETIPGDRPEGSVIARLAPIVALAGLVLGGIYGGVFTPTEAGAAGALGALLIALLKRRLNWTKLWRVLAETGYVTASICLLIIAAAMYSRMLALSGITGALSGLFGAEANNIAVLIALYIVIVILLGTILDSVSIMLIVVPLVLPALTANGIDLIWFGIITITAVEIGLLTPPFGLSVYVIKSTLDDDSVSLGDIFIGAIPFVLAMLVVLLILIAFPTLSTVLL